MAVQLIVKKGPLKGLVISLAEGTKWSLGKDGTKSDIPIQDTTLADCQILIYKEQVGYFIRNLDAKFIVKINGRVLSKEILLKPDDVILLGQNEFVLQGDENDSDSVEFGFEEVSKTPQQLDKQSSAGEKVAPPINLKDVDKSALPEVNLNQPDSSTGSSKTNQERKPEQIDKEAIASLNLKDVDKSLLPEVKLSQTGSPGKGEKPAAVDEEGMVSSSRSPEISNVDEKDKMPLDNQENNQKMKKEETDQSDNQAKAEPDVPPENPEAVQPSTESSASGEDKAEEAEETGETQNLEKQDGNSESKDQPSEMPKVENTQDAIKKTSVEKSNANKNPSVAFGIKDLFDFDENLFSVEDESADSFVDLSHISRFLLKVVAGPNIGAEFSLEVGKNYIVGSDASVCDLVFNDLSVSHKHAELIVSNEGNIVIEDESSKNGIIVDGKKIENSSPVQPNQVVALGTTLFLIIDREAPVETIVSSLFLPETYVRSVNKEEPSEEEMAAILAKNEETKATISTGAFILALFVGGLAILFGIGAASLFRTKEINPIENIDFNSELEDIIKPFSGVRFTYNKNNGQLFLIGHIDNSISKSELLYKLDAMSFVKSIDDNIIDDELVWQEMNIFLSKHADFKGVSMHSPGPGIFVLTGYLQTEEQAANLVDYLNIHFNYVSLLQNKVVVERVLLKEIGGLLLQGGFMGVNVSFSSGDLILTGYVSDLKDGTRFINTIEAMSSLPGVRNIKNFVVVIPNEEGVADLNVKQPNRYRVTGFSKYGDVNINVVVNGRIVTRGDVIDGMTITSIQSNCIFLEKNGIKFKIEYNK